jgi:hypothetical protein
VEDSLKELDWTDLRFNVQNLPALKIGYNKDFDPLKGLATAIRTVNSDLRNTVIESNSQVDGHEYSDIFYHTEHADLVGSETPSILHVMDLKDAYSNAGPSQHWSSPWNWPKPVWEARAVSIFATFIAH